MSTKTTRMSIDIPTNDHKKLKILANAYGMSLKDFVLSLIDPFLHPGKVPNRTTCLAMKEGETSKTVKCEDLQDLWKKLGI